MRKNGKCVPKGTPSRSAFTGALLAALAALLMSFCPFLPQQAQAAEVVADVATSEGAFKNIAAGVNFWGQDTPRERFMNEVGTDLYRIKLRLDKVLWHTASDTFTGFILSDVKNDSISDVINDANTAIGNGCRIMVQIYGIPKWLSLSDDDRVLLNNLPNYAKYPPSDFNQWARVVYEGVRVLHRAGLQQVDYFELFGEPNVGSTWYQQMMPCRRDGKVVRGCEPNELGHNTVQVMQNLFLAYKYAALGVRAAHATAKIGGLAILPEISGVWWTRFLARQLLQYNAPLDFYSWHWFNIDGRLSALLAQVQAQSPITPEMLYQYYRDRLREQGFTLPQITTIVYDIYDYLFDLEQRGQEAVRRPYTFVSSHLARIMAEEGLGDRELFVTEWNVNTGRDRRHDTHYGAAFVTRGLLDITDSAASGQTFYSLSSFRFYPDDNGFGGFHSLFTLDGFNVPKASFNAFKLFSMLGHGAGVQRISTASDDNDVYAIATRDGQEISLLSTYYTLPADPESPDYSLSKTVRLAISNVPFADYEYEMYLIDSEHSNGFYNFNAELVKIESGTGTGDFEKIMDLAVYGVVMVKLHEVF